MLEKRNRIIRYKEIADSLKATGADQRNSYTAVVIAAGLSKRMGRFKPLIDVGGRPALFHLLDTIRAVPIIKQIIIVTGHEREKVEDAVAAYAIENEKDTTTINYIDTIYNHEYENGMFSSVRAGVRKMAEHSAALLFPADVPLVSAETIAGLIDNFETYGLLRFARNDGGGDCDDGGDDCDDKKDVFTPPEVIKRPFAVPVYRGRNGHPLLIPKEYYSEILEYDGEGGLKGVRGRYDADMIRYETDDEGCVLDMDTQEDYEKLLEYHRRSTNR
jgi:CTP:molybdopterin cytidylyltransferase MocA